METTPAEKLLLRLTKEQLLYKACEYRLVSVNHNKAVLAKAIAEHEEKMFSNAWSAISKGGTKL